MLFKKLIEMLRTGIGQVFSLIHDEYLPLLLDDVWVSYSLDVSVIRITYSEILEKEKYQTDETISRELRLLFLGLI